MLAKRPLPWLVRRIVWLGILSWIAGLSFFGVLSWSGIGVAHAQTRAAAAASGSANAGTQAPSDDDDEAADSPRASVRSFLDLCDRSRYADAARYLDTSRNTGESDAELARKLSAVLNERLNVDLDRLSPASQGQKDPSTPPGTQELGKLKDGKGRFVSIRIVRHESRSPEDEPRWVFSQSTVQNVDALYASLNGRWVRNHLPEALLSQGWWGLYYWQWLAFPVLALLCTLLGHALTWVLDHVVRRMISHWAWSAVFLRRMRRPMTMAVALFVFWTLVPYLALTLRAEDVLGRVLRALGYLAFFWALLRAVTVAGDEISNAPWSMNRPSLRSLTSFGVKVGKFMVAAMALMAAMSELGYPVTSVVAGFGLGGIALALAAQKTVENLFGSISILADQPFLVGDTIRVDGVEGTVERIGVRSTRLRTADRTAVIIPNGKLADMRIESLGPRDRIRFATKIVLDRATPIAKVEAVLAGLKKKLSEHPKIESKNVWVHLVSLGDVDGSGFSIEVASLVETRDFTEFAGIRDALLVACSKIIEEQGARLSLPSRRFVPNDPKSTPETEGETEAAPFPTS